jgi:hypothetical protein
MPAIAAVQLLIAKLQARRVLPTATLPPSIASTHVSLKSLS